MRVADYESVRGVVGLAPWLPDSEPADHLRGRRLLVAHGTIPTKPEYDPSLLAGEKVVEETGAPARTTSVRRRVYGDDGKLLYDATFYSSYRAEPTLVRVGTHPRPKPPPKLTDTTKSKPKPPSTTTTTTTTTQP